jgi:TRAP transporter 4TM/12TM fusion protein
MADPLVKLDDAPQSTTPMLVRIIAVVMSIFQLVTGVYQFTAMNQRVIHVTFALVLIYLYYDIRLKKRKSITWDGYLLALVVFFLGVYVFFAWFARITDMGMEPPLHELICGGVFIILLIEAARRSLGMAFPLVSIGALIYGRFGEMLPGILAHKDYPWDRLISSLFITTDGVFGMLAGLSATYVFLFILFGSVLRVSGGGEFFINLSYSLIGNFRGGPAKIAVIASSLFGMISGSGTANVASIGQITIPLMKRTGMTAVFAGAVETVSSAGGLLMPPIMGSAVFIIMEILGVTYVTIMKAAILSAVLYYTGIFMMIDIEAQKKGMVGIPRSELPDFWKTLKEGWFYFIPVYLLVHFLAISQFSLTKAIFWSVFSIPLCTFFGGRKKAMTIKKILQGLEEGALTALPVVAVLTLAGVVLGVVTLTGLGLMMSSLLIKLSGGELMPLLVMTMVASLILGMGVPPVAAYVVLAILVVPALIELGVYPLAAHLFVFYFSIIAGITPPMAPDAYVAAGIAEGPMMKTALQACRLAITIFIIPYVFVYNNALLLVGSLGEIIEVCITATLGVSALAFAVQGYMNGPLKWYERICMLAAALLLITPGWITDVMGAILYAIFFTIRYPHHARRFTIGLFEKRREA